MRQDWTYCCKSFKATSIDAIRKSISVWNMETNNMENSTCWFNGSTPLMYKFRNLFNGLNMAFSLIEVWIRVSWSCKRAICHHVWTSKTLMFFQMSYASCPLVFNAFLFIMFSHPLWIDPDVWIYGKALQHWLMGTKLSWCIYCIRYVM